MFEFRAPPGVHMHKLRLVGDHILYVNSERIPGPEGDAARAEFYIFDISNPGQPREVGFFESPEADLTVSASTTGGSSPSSRTMPKAGTNASSGRSTSGIR